MSRLDAAASDALDAAVVKPVYFVWLDFIGDELRANSTGQVITLSGSGLDYLDGEFLGVASSFVDISEVRIGDGGAETVTAKVSGLPGIDQDTLDMIADPTNWRGRQARLWRMVRNDADVQQGGVQHYHGGYMVDCRIAGSPSEQMITVTIESYLASLSKPSNRTYLDQALFDPGDESARAAIAIANGTTGVGGSGAAVGGSAELARNVQRVLKKF